MTSNIVTKYPKSWNYFQDFFLNHYSDQFKTIESFTKLPFEFQLGVYITFFNSVSTDVDIYSNEAEALIDAITEAFAQYEEYLFLDS